MNSSNSRIIRNTIAQYLRVLVVAIVNIISVRLILNELGVQDYGIFTLIAGFVTLLGILNSTMIVSTQRYISCEIAANNRGGVTKIYSSSVIIHIGISVFVIFIAETAGLYFLTNHLEFPEGKLDDAIIVYQCVIASFVLNVLSIPQQAALIAYEKMILSSIIGIFEAVLKILIVVLLCYLDGNKLITYSILFLSSSVIVRFLYNISVIRTLKLRVNFKNCISTIRSIIGFAWWNLLGGISNLLKIQGVNVILNFFGGTTINASYGIANQVNSQLLVFTSSIFQSTNSQTIQAYKNNNYDRLGLLINSITKYAFALYFIITIPLIILSSEVLSAWLGQVPPYCDIFVPLMLTNSYIELFSTPLMYIMQANGKIKWYFVIISSVMLLILPASYVFLSLGFAPPVVVYTTIIVNILLLLFRLIFVQKVANYGVKTYLYQVIIPSIVLILLSFIIYRLLIFLGFTLLNTAIIVELFSIIFIFLFLLNTIEKKYILNYAAKIFKASK